MNVANRALFAFVTVGRVASRSNPQMQSLLQSSKGDERWSRQSASSPRWRKADNKKRFTLHLPNPLQDAKLCCAHVGRPPAEMQAAKERISALRVDDALFVDTLGLWTSLSDPSGREGVLEFWADNVVTGKVVNTIGIGLAILCFKGIGEWNTFRKGTGEEQKISIIWVQMEEGADSVAHGASELARFATEC